MIAPAGNASFHHAPRTAFGTGSGAAALKAQLATYRRQLAECLDCSSSRTPQGQAEIQQLSARIGGIQTRIEKIRDEQVPVAASVQMPSSPQGGLIDVYA